MVEYSSRLPLKGQDCTGSDTAAGSNFSSCWWTSRVTAYSTICQKLSKAYWELPPILSCYGITRGRNLMPQRNSRWSIGTHEFLPIWTPAPVQKGFIIVFTDICSRFHIIRYACTIGHDVIDVINHLLSEFSVINDLNSTTLILKFNLLHPLHTRFAMQIL